MGSEAKADAHGRGGRHRSPAMLHGDPPGHPARGRSRSCHGRSPGSRVTAPSGLPETSRSQWHSRTRLSAYSCGGSSGLGEHA
ncbi:hypothetical protein N177_2365 [Lutibaculum baratangense AMV1]|uniref:Uncharacterized protein n=1 Tax=Lutibaculum baratangense AMV1 TaxID=631454 RepID=V4REG9_9HYPH|nr:hypothetical protein N177_2365 [Lutibaculum baratangense AMV1]